MSTPNNHHPEDSEEWNRSPQSDYDPYRYIQPGAEQNTEYSKYQQMRQSGFDQQYTQQYAAPYTMPVSTDPQPGYPTHGVALKGGEEPPAFPVRNGAEKIDLGDALIFGVRRLNKTLLPWLGIMALYAGVVIAVMIVAGVWAFSAVEIGENGSSSAGDMGFAGGVFLALVLVAIVFLLATQVILTRGAFEIIDGRKLTFGDFFKVGRWGSIIGAYIVSGIFMLVAMIPAGAIMIGCSTALDKASAGTEGIWVAGLFVGILALFVTSVLIQPITMVMPLLVFDGEVSVLESPAKAWQVVKPQYWRVMLCVLVVSLINSVASWTYIALLYTVPMVLIAQVYVYRILVGGRRLINVPQNQDF